MAFQHHESVERELGEQAHDGTVRGGEYSFQLLVRRLQGDPRVYRRLHLPLHQIQRRQPDPERGTLPQTYRRLVLRVALCTCLPTIPLVVFTFISPYLWLRLLYKARVLNN